MSDLRLFAEVHGYTSVAIGVAIPLLLRSLVMHKWKPRTRLIYALKFSLWPVIIFTYFLGGPISREIFGIESRYLMDLNQTFKGVIGLSMISTPVFFAIGWWKAVKFFAHNNENAKSTK